MKSKFNHSTQETQQSNANFYAFLATSFTSFLKDNHCSSNQWLQLCSNFLLITRDLFDLIDAYCNSDSIFLELYYERFASIWHALGQHHNLECVWKQMEQLYLDIDYFKLQVIRTSCTIRRFNWITAKHPIAQDEMMELINHWYSLFPMMQTMKGFCERAFKLGYCLCAKYLLTRLATSWMQK